MWSFLMRHLDLLLGVVTVAVWFGTIGWYLRNDIRRAWQAYQNRWP